MRSCMIFDKLTNDFNIRKEAILMKLEETGMKLSLTELMSLNLFVGINCHSFTTIWKTVHLLFNLVSIDTKTNKNYLIFSIKNFYFIKISYKIWQ